MGKPRILVVLGHPDPDSFNQALFEAYVGALDSDRWQIETLELGKLDFDPVLRFGYRQRMPNDPVIERSQELVVWADHLTFVYPVWWWQTPALLSGWFDRVFTPGVAFNDTGRGWTKHLTGRTATIVQTSHAPSPISWAMSNLLVKRFMLGFCGIKATKVLRHGQTGRPSDSPQRRAAFLERVTAAAKAAA